MPATVLAPPDLLPPLDVPRSPQQLRSRRKHERLIIAGMMVFDRLGYHRATVDALTADAEVSTGTFYAYFRDKRQLLVYLVGEQLDSLAYELMHLDLSADPLSALEQLLEELIGPEAVCPSIWRAWKEASAHDEELAAYDRKIDAWMRSLLVKALDRVGEEGGLRPGLDRSAAARVVAALLWQLLPERQEEPEALARAAARMLYHALFADRPS